METTKIQIQLAQKLGDPVIDSNTDGVIYSAELRRNYLQRAYASLIRIIDRISLQKVPTFVDRIRNVYLDIEDNKVKGEPENGSLRLTGITEIKSIILQSESKFYKTTYIKPEDWAGVWSKLNNLYDPKIDNPYWSIIGDTLKFEPTNYTKILITCIQEPTIDFSKSTFGLTTDYEDLFLNLACIEGFLDNGDKDKIQLYREHVNWNLTILSNRAIYEDRKE